MSYSRLPFAIFALLLLATACSSAPDEAASGAESSTNNSAATDSNFDPNSDSNPAGGTSPSIAGAWLLSELTVDSAAVSVPAVIKMEIELGKMAGSTGCNQFGATIERTDDGGLSISDLSQTEVGCGQALSEFEVAYVEALRAATRWEVGPDGLTLSSPSATLSYGSVAPPPNVELVGTAWQFDTVFSGVGVDRTASSSDTTKESATLILSRRNEVSHSADSATLRVDDCDDFNFPVVVEEGTEGQGSISVPEGATPADEGCGSSNLLTAFDGISQARGFMIDQKRLTFIGEPGELVGFKTE